MNDKSDTVKERPILFSGLMVKAILENRKSQTRRILKPQIWSEAESTPGGCGYAWSPKGQKSSSFAWNTTEKAVAEHVAKDYCPYGKLGDRLWVRETFRHYGNHYNAGKSFALVQYEDSSTRSIEIAYPPQRDNWERKQAGRFMPRWASRLTLEITGVRVERLQEISEADAIDEGMEREYLGKGKYPTTDVYGSYTDAFAKLWDIVNGKAAPWSSNPFVWIIEFKKLEVAA